VITGWLMAGAEAGEKEQFSSSTGFGVLAGEVGAGTERDAWVC